MAQTPLQARRRMPTSARGWALVALAVAAVAGTVPTLRGAEPGSAFFYSTARPPLDYPGRKPVARPDLAVRPARNDAPVNAEPPVSPAPTRHPDPLPGGAVTRLATATSDAPADRAPLDLEARTEAGSARTRVPAPTPAIEDPIVRAKRIIASCQTRYQQVRDYTCTFYKRERIDNELQAFNVMQMKARTRPFSVYFRFTQPYSGREAIYVHGRNANKVVVHDVGLNKVLAGTLELDTRSRRAMDGNRHPITEAGLGNLIETVARRWAVEMQPGETQVKITPNVKVGDRVCTMIESTHPRRSPNYMFRTAKVYVDSELNLPIRFEAYDWPHRAGGAPVLMEEYTYTNLRLNVGLSERDFDPSNASYSFGRF